jgi:SPP1 gp7 family putative phage head morphogenesis protein
VIDMLIYPKVKIEYPMSLEREYARDWRTYVNEVLHIINDYVPEMVAAEVANGIKADERMDNWIDDITSKVSWAINRVQIDKKAERMYDRIKNFAIKQANKPYKSIFGATLQAGKDGDYRTMKSIWVSQNQMLAAKVNAQAIETLHYSIAENMVKAASSKEIRAELQASIGQLRKELEKRAVLIGSDQVGKAYSQLAQYEQQMQGIDSYIWVTVGDSRVRPRHAARAGKRYYWDRPPEGGHPGYDYRCRCVAVPVYDTDKIGLQPKAGSYKNV